jgi:hypothetical protein
VGRRVEAILLAVALAAVALFAGSFLVGLLQSGSAEPRHAADPPPATTSLPDPRPALRVEVLNASGIAGLARRATESLRAGGFDVVFYGNAPRDASSDSSAVLDRSGDVAAAREIGRLLGIGPVRTERDTTRLVDVSVIIGRDWPGDAER